MKRFSCSCGNPVFFENRHCTRCGATLGFDAERLAIVTLTAADGAWIGVDGKRYRDCRNQLEHESCNWLVTASEQQDYCASCRLNRTIPNLAVGENYAFWQRIEQAKRRLLYSLLWLGLPVLRQTRGWPQGLLFDFIEIPHAVPACEAEAVMTGHKDGVITINVAEADDVFRAMQRKHMNEAYRTLLGHFRHESGHYFFDYLVNDENKLQQFRQLFGDERADYPAALDRYYQLGPPADWQSAYISAYCTAHPCEDWAESWAHYLHMLDCLETGAGYGLVDPLAWDDSLESWLEEWPQFTVLLNELNRAMGLRDAYPFVISTIVTDKLRFIHRLLRAAVHTT